MRRITAGAVGLNLEDGTGNASNPLMPVEQHAEKVRRIRDVGDSLGVHVVINARTDVYLEQVGEPGSRFEHAVRRLAAYRRAGADSL